MMKSVRQGRFFYAMKYEKAGENEISPA